ncbi:MAG TPA: GTPase [Candidatus Azoamicus sp. MARI]
MKIISIIGQKNVGKSSLFNLLTKSELSTSINYSGYTRDCISSNIKIGSSLYKIYDTPGFDYDDDELNMLVVKQAWRIIKNADLIIFLTDIMCNSRLDKNLFNIINKVNNKKIYLLNKVDLLKESLTFNKSYSLKNFIHISVKNRFNIDSMLTSVTNAFLNEVNLKYKEQKSLKISIIGRQNVGKSSFFNKLINKDMSLVFNQRGTTRDFIFNFISKNSCNYTITDTPGIKKHNFSSLDHVYFEKIDKLIKSSDVIFFVSDINENITKYDMSLINYILNIKKTLVLILNKADLLKKNHLKDAVKSKIYKTNLLKNINFRFISSKYNFGIRDIFIYLNKIKKIKIKFESKILLPSVKSLLFSGLNIKKIDVVNYYPFSVSIYTKEKILYNQKKHISAFFIKNFFLKGMPLKLSFK